jgi:hypothetical protein
MGTIMAEPRRYKAYFIEPGVVDYAEGDRRETVLIRKNVLDKMLPSFLGRPVWDFVHRPEVDPVEAFNWGDGDADHRPDGIVSDAGYDPDEGMYYAMMMIWDEETQKNIEENDFNVSCAYRVENTGPGGTHNAVPFDEEVLSAIYHHMSVVEDPRYEDSRIFANSKKEGIMKLKLNMGKKVRQNMVPMDAGKPDEDEMAVNEDAVLKIEGESEEIPVSELVAAYKEKQSAGMAENEDDEDGQYMNMEDTIEIDGEEVSMKDLYENYKGMKQNAEPPTDEPLDPPSEDDEEGLRSNSAGRRQKPNENFRRVRSNANAGEPAEKPRPNTSKQRLERGRNRYGTPVSNKGKE